MTRRGVLAMGAAFGAVPLFGCGSLFPERYRFRLTVEVDTPQGLRTGSSVMELRSGLQTIPGRGVVPRSSSRGEAVTVDLPGMQTLFALVGSIPDAGGDLDGHVTLLFEPNYSGPESFVASVKKLGRRDQRGRTVVLPPDKYPRLVTFRDIADPKSVQAVDPASLAASFGPGVTLRRITATITGDDVTTGIEKRLGWLSPHPEPGLDNDFTATTTPTFAQMLRHGDFQEGTR